MSQRPTHPYDKHISNGVFARLLVFFSNHHVPFLGKLYGVFLNSEINMPLPQRTFLPHPFGIIVSGGCKLGIDVVIGQQVTIGNRNGILAAPVIGNRVYIGAGSKVLGPITIGDDVIIGANSVVTKDIPAGVTVVGANRILPRQPGDYWTSPDAS